MWFFEKIIMDGYLPKEHDQHKPSQKESLSDLFLNLKNKNHSLTYGNKLLILQSLQSDEATQPRIHFYTCPLCKKPYPTAEQFKEHLGEHVIYFICKACGRSFTRPRTLRNHLQHYCKKRPLMCKVCNNIYHGVEVLKKHCEVHFKDPEYICGFCGEKHGRYLCFKNQYIGKSKLKELSLAVNSPRKGSASPAILQEVNHHRGEYQSNVYPGTSQKLMSIRDPLIYNATGNPKPRKGEVILVRGSSSVKANAVVASGKYSPPIAFAIPRDTWKGMSLGEPSLTDGVDYVTIPLEKSFSNRFSYSTNIVSPQTSREYSPDDRPTQNEILEIGAYVELGTRGDNQRAFLEGSSLDMPFSTNAAIHPSFFECSSSTNSPQSVTGNHEAFLKGISLKGFASVIETPCPRIYQEDLTQNRSPSQSEISEKATSLTWVTLKPPSSVTENDNRSAYLKGPSLEASFLKSLADHPPFLAPSSLKSPSQSKIDNHEVLSEISSEGFSPSIEILKPKISHEDLSFVRPSQNNIPEKSSYPKHKNSRAPSSVKEIDKLRVFSDGPSSSETLLLANFANPSSVLDGSSSSRTFYTRKDNHEVCLGGTTAEKTQISTCSIDDQSIPFAKELELGTLSSFEISPSLHEFPKRAFEKTKSFSDTNDLSHFSENNLPNNYMALGLPADMYEISSNFQNIEMSDMLNESHRDNSVVSVNEGDDIFPQWSYSMKSEAGKELIDHEYGTEYDASEMNDNLNFANEDPEYYYLDSLDYLKCLND
ncbi:uncharacterized protein [Palaemon carinicauda]|uniref:uncharacterized protein n=1 Tax=Palaemon carinicauda TaxID=392227 RepID=UPI0035B5A310